jgi:hypothetical protein
MVSRGSERNALRHSRSPLKDEPEKNDKNRNKRSTFAARRKAAKLLKAQQSPNALRKGRVHSPGESDSSEEEQGEVEEEDHAPPDDTEDDDGEPRAFAPSGAANLRVNIQNSKKLLKRSLPSKAARQAGLNGLKRQKLSHSRKTASSQKPSDLDSPNLARTSENVSASPSPTLLAIADEYELMDDGVSSDDDDDDDEDDDAIYNLIDMMSDDDEDDLEVEAIEEQMLLAEMEANGELNALMFGDGDTMFPDEDGVSTFNVSVVSDRYGITEDGSELPILKSGHGSTAGDATPKAANSNMVTPYESDTELNALVQSALTSPIAGDFAVPFPLDTSPIMEDFRGETGLCTPSSIKQPMAWIDCDPDETEDDEPKQGNFTVKVSALKKKSNSIPTSRITASGIRKTKKFKTPKAGSFKISKDDVCLSHNRKGKLVMSGSKKVSNSGYNTPRGIVPVDPLKITPSEEFPNAIRTLEFSSLDENIPLSAVEQATHLLFQSTALPDPLFPDASTMESTAFNSLPVNADDDMTRYISLEDH